MIVEGPNRAQRLAQSASGRLWLLLPYWAFGFVMRWPTVALSELLPPGSARELVRLAVKTTLSVILGALLVRHLRPGRPLSEVLGVRARPDAPRRPLRAGLIAVAYATLLFVLSTLQEGHAPDVVPPGVVFAILAIANIVVEELAFRGLILGWLADGRAFFRANAITSLLFVSMHLPSFLAHGFQPVIVPMLIVLFLLSLVLGWVTRLSGTIWIAVALHVANNALSGW